MTPAQVSLIRETWRQVVPRADQVAALFYKRLFEIDPSLRELFTEVDLAAQGRRLAKALGDLVAALDSIEDFVPALEVLGRRHVGYGVRDQHYDSVGEALLWTLETGLGPAWTGEAAEAWGAAYRLVVGAMRCDGLPQAPLPPSEAAAQLPTWLCLATAAPGDR